MPRIPLRSSLVAIAILALGLGAITSQSRLAAGAAYTAYWLVNLLALTGALVARGPARAFCTGCAVFGLGYWLLAFEAEPQQPRASSRTRLWTLRLAALVDAQATVYGTEQTGDRLLTAELVDRIEEAIRPRLVPGAKVTAQYNGGGYFLGTIQSFNGSDYIVAWDDGTPPSPVPPVGIRGLVFHVRTSAHSVLGLLVALIGGQAARILFASFGPTGRHREDRSARV